jgi:hypothetical protein
MYKTTSPVTKYLGPRTSLKLSAKNIRHYYYSITASLEMGVPDGPGTKVRG